MMTANWAMSIACSQPTLNFSRSSLISNGRVAENVKGNVRRSSAGQRALNALIELPNIREINPAAKLIAQSKAAKAIQLHTIRGYERDRLDACHAANAASAARAKSVRTTRKLRVNNQLWGRGKSFRAARTSPASTMLRDALKTLKIIHLFLKYRAERGIHMATVTYGYSDVPEIPGSDSDGTTAFFCNPERSE